MDPEGSCSDSAPGAERALPVEALAAPVARSPSSTGATLFKGVGVPIPRRSEMLSNFKRERRYLWLYKCAQSPESQRAELALRRGIRRSHENKKPRVPRLSGMDLPLDAMVRGKLAERDLAGLLRAGAHRNPHNSKPMPVKTLALLKQELGLRTV